MQTIYQIQIEYPYSTRENWIYDRIFFDLNRAIQEAREMQKELQEFCDDDEPRVILWEMIAGREGFFRHNYKIIYDDYDDDDDV